MTAALPRRTRGFALVLAVFLIVSLAAIGAYLLTVTNVQVESTTKDELGGRAYQAARAGLEWGTYRVLRDLSCAPGPGPIVITFPTVPPASAHLAGFYAEVTCVDFGPETEGGGTVNTFRIVSTGCNLNPCSPGAPGSTYVERQLQLTVTR
jgi:MSHA biogenesis protein MshP